MHLFVYYKFLPSDFPAIESQAIQLVERVEVEIPGVRAQLLKRPEVGADGQHTWMEAYECEAAHFEALRACVELTAARLDLPKARRVEVFVAV